MTLDPEQFRIKVGNYKDRWYVDTLPGCSIAPAAPEWQAPAVSTIKKASSKDWTQVAIKRAAEWVFKHDISFDGQDPDSIGSALSQANSNALDLASARGVQIHKMFEVYAEGGNPESVELGYEASAYRQTVLRCIRTMKPDIVLSEFLAMNRAVGYGGTGDAVWRMDGKNVLIDYKSRGENHAAYLEEAWQVAAYAKAEYYLAENAHGEVIRILPPEFSEAMILSITPTSYQFYPVDIERAWPGFVTLRDHWQHRRDGKKGIFGKEWQPPLTRDQWIRDRIDIIKQVDVTALKRVWPEDIAPPKKHEHPFTDAEVNLLDIQLGFAEKQLSIGFGVPDPGDGISQLVVDMVDTWLHKITGTVHTDVEESNEGPAMPDEGELAPASLPLIAQRFHALRAPQQEWISSVVVEARDCGLPIRVAETPTERRVAIAKALIRAAERGLTIESLKGALEVVSVFTEATLRKMPFGAAVGTLTAIEAKAWLELVKMLDGDHKYDVEPDPNMEIARKGAPITKSQTREKAKPATTATKPRKAAAKKAAPKPTRSNNAKQ